MSPQDRKSVVGSLHVVSAINIAKISPTPKNIPSDTDAPDDADGDDSYDLNSTDDNADYTKLIHLSLRNHNQNGKITPDNKKEKR